MVLLHVRKFSRWNTFNQGRKRVLLWHLLGQLVAKGQVVLVLGEEWPDAVAREELLQK